jgi:hypothetical protein
MGGGTVVIGEGGEVTSELIVGGSMAEVPLVVHHQWYLCHAADPITAYFALFAAASNDLTNRSFGR